MVPRHPCWKCLPWSSVLMSRSLKLRCVMCATMVFFHSSQSPRNLGTGSSMVDHDVTTYTKLVTISKIISHSVGQVAPLFTSICFLGKMVHLHGHSANISGKKNKIRIRMQSEKHFWEIRCSFQLQLHSVIICITYIWPQNSQLYLHRRLWCIDFPFLWNVTNCKTRCESADKLQSHVLL